MGEQQLLQIVVPAAIRDDVVDILIALDFVSGFNLEKIAGYSREHSHYSTREQVVGFRDLFRIEVMHAVSDRSRLLAALEPVCAGAKCRYFVQPILESGHFGDL